MTDVDLHIERLILDGMSLAPAGRRQLQTALEARLTDLFTEGAGNGLLAGGSVDRIRAAPMALTGGEDPTAVGSELANVVYSSLQRGSNRWP